MRYEEADFAGELKSGRTRIARSDICPSVVISVARGHWVTCTPRAERKIWGPNLLGNVVSTTPGMQSKSPFLGNWGDLDGEWLIYCVLRSTTKKVVIFVEEEMCISEKILATPMSIFVC